MDIAIGIVAIVVVIAVIAWFVLGRGPFDEEGVERPRDRSTGDRGQGHFAPGGPGAERQVPPHHA